MEKKALEKNVTKRSQVALKIDRKHSGMSPSLYSSMHFSSKFSPLIPNGLASCLTSVVSSLASGGALLEAASESLTLMTIN